MNCGVEDGKWQFLYRTAAIAALITTVLFLVQIVAFYVWPPPSTVAGHFALLQSRTFVGLISLDFLIIVDEVLAIPISLALYLSLRSAHDSLVLIATALAAASIVCFLIATPALNMLYLSQQYAASTIAVEREGLLAAGQAVLSSWQGTPYQGGLGRRNDRHADHFVGNAAQPDLRQGHCICWNRRERNWLWGLCAQGRSLHFHIFSRGHASVVRDDCPCTFAPL
jgi:hypothetical protein